MVLALLVLFVPRESYAKDHIQINEVRINQPGTDDDEYFELLGPHGFSLDLYTYLVIGDGGGGASGVIEAVIPLTGQAIDSGGFFVAAEPTFTLGVPDLVTNLTFENSDNVTHMLVEGFTGKLGQDLDTNDDCVLDFFPWATVVDVIAVILEPNPPVTTECHYGPPTVGPDGPFAPGHVKRCPDSTGDFVIAAFELGIDDTPGAANLCPRLLYEPGTMHVPLAVPTSCVNDLGCTGGALCPSDTSDGIYVFTVLADLPAGPPTERLPIAVEKIWREGEGHDNWIDVASINWGQSRRAPHRPHVYGFSGEFTLLRDVDLDIPGRCLTTTIGRKYRSRVGPDTAQGNGWDYSYNVFIERQGSNIVLHDGNTRQDLYIDQGDGTWGRREFFREFTEISPDTFQVMFADTGVWTFRPLDGGPAEGKIAAITDRNGNTLTFDYDPQERLSFIHDPLDNPPTNPRVIAIAYNADGFIESITDWINRSVTYEYYDGIEPGGNFGDLKSVTTPVVTGTPNGNDFPMGKTTVYTYTTGFADPRLNGDLLTITDPKHQLFLRNEYAHTIDMADSRFTLDPANLNYDRVVRQYWGDQQPLTGDIIDLVYVPETPTPGNNFAVIKVIVNDRVGNVKEFFYDSGNRGVIQHEYTGRWDPDQPTFDADLAFPTFPKLRAADPASFETLWEWNDDSLTTRIVHPNLNEEEFVYDDVDNPDLRSRGNMLEHRWLPGPLGGDQMQICETYVYDPDFGCGGCSTNFVTEHTDGRGNVTLQDFDASGNRTHTTHRIRSIMEDFEFNQFGQMTAHILPDNSAPVGHRRRDEFTFYTSADGIQNGYLKEQIIDFDDLKLTTTFEYDAVGNTTRTIDPENHDMQYVYNQLDQVVRSISAEVTPGGGVRYERDTFYDANDNVVRVDIQNKDDAGDLQDNTHFTTIREFEILNHQVRMCEEVGDFTGAIPGTQQVPLCTGLPERDFITTEYAYDANRNHTLMRYGEAVNGNQPTNVVRTLYDERDLTFRAIRAPGVAGPGGQSTDQTDYDGNKNVATTRQGIENAPRITTNTFDGYDRLTISTDPMGNTIAFEYDENHNRVAGLTEGELHDVPGGAGNDRLTEMSYVYDEMDRITRTDAEFFDTEAEKQDPIGDGKSTTLTVFSPNSQVISVTNDNSHTTTTTYDTANRVSTVTDAKGNIVKFETAEGQSGYDANSNVVAMLEVEKSDLGNQDEEFTTTREYDGLDRLIQTKDNLGNTEKGAESNTMVYGYDSRDNQTVMTDALDRETRYVYDGINRLTKTVRDTNDDGANAAAIPGDGDPDIATTQGWDDTSRLAEQTDDSNNTTAYTYDSLNRMTAETYADTTVHAYTFAVHDNKLTMLDANGSLADCTYDLLNRLTHKDITPGPDVANDITVEDYSYDGLSRLVSAGDDDSLVTRSYDSLSNVTRETLNGTDTSTDLFDGVGNELISTYPGGRVIERTYDELERKKTINDVGAAVTVATYDYVGPGRVTRREYGNGTRSDYAYDGITGTPNPPNDFGVKRIIGTTHTKIAGGAIIDDRTFTWDKMYNKTQRRDVRAGGPQLTHDYTYDDIYRLIHTTVTDSGANVVRDTWYDLDGVGNRTQVMGAPDPGPHVGPYTMDPTLPEPADLQMNQYTTTSADARLYDENGNLIRIDNGLPTQRDIKYDYRNQMVEYLVVATGERHTYAYDALGRRIIKVVDADGLGPGSPTETRYFYDGWQVVEEQDAGNATLATYVYGLYIDEVLNMKRSGSDSYHDTDDLYNVMALTDGAGDVVERYEYGEYGQPTITEADGRNVSCPFDVNGDGQVGAFDLANLLGCWGLVTPGVCERLDIDDNGTIDAFDLANLLGGWGDCPTRSSAVGNPYMFTGRRSDQETGWYYYRTRYLDPAAGRFTTRDTIGLWGDETNLGNGYTYVGNNPWSAVDPTGMGPQETGPPDILRVIDLLCGPRPVGSFGQRPVGPAAVPGSSTINIGNYFLFGHFRGARSIVQRPPEPPAGGLGTNTITLTVSSVEPAAAGGTLMGIVRDLFWHSGPVGPGVLGMNQTISIGGNRSRAWASPMSLTAPSSVPVGMLLPAVQQVREAARRQGGT